MGLLRNTLTDYFKHKSISVYHLKKCWMGNQIYISQLSTSLFFYKLLFEVKRIDMRLHKIVKLKFILMFFDSAYPTRPSDNVTKYTIYPPPPPPSHYLVGGKTIQMVLGLILLFYPMASKTWLKNALHFTF